MPAAAAATSGVERRASNDCGPRHQRYRALGSRV